MLLLSCTLAKITLTILWSNVTETMQVCGQKQQTSQVREFFFTVLQQRIAQTS